MATQDQRQEALDKFRKYVISQARRNLTMQGKKASGALYKSLNGKPGLVLLAKMISSAFLMPS
jgi:hypothetical protein